MGKLSFFQRKVRAKKEEQRFGAYRCGVCGRTDVYKSLFATPTCCGRAMSFLHVMFQGADPDAVNIDVILIWPPAEQPEGRGNVWPGPAGFWIYEAPRINWHFSSQTPEAVWEVYQLRPGRYEGERIGWIGRRPDRQFEFRAPPGVREASSFGLRSSRNECVEALVDAVNEG